MRNTLLESFGFKGIKSFITKTIKNNRILFETEKFKESDKTITFVVTKFSTANYKRLNKIELAALS